MKVSANSSDDFPTFSDNFFRAELQNKYNLLHKSSFPESHYNSEEKKAKNKVQLINFSSVNLLSRKMINNF